MKIKTLLVMFFTTFATIASAEGIDQKVNETVGPVLNVFTNLIFSTVPFFGKDVPWVVIWLVVAASFFTIYFKFINLRSFRHGFALMRGKYNYTDAPGEVTHFQALTTALSGTVGLGNIAGVATAVSLGGAGATFWMVVCGFLGMSSKFVECTLGVKYRDILPNGHVHGGPMRYLTKGFAEKGMAGFGKVLAIVFAIMCIGGSFGGGNMFQVNQALAQIVSVSGEDYSLIKQLESQIKLDVNIEEGFVTISATMPEPTASAQLTLRAQELLQEYALRFKTQKSKEQLRYIKARFLEKQKEFNSIKIEFASFQDQNNSINTALGKTKLKELQSEYDIKFSVYNELAKQLEAQRLQVKKDSPLFTVLNPVTVPLLKSAPKRSLILVTHILLGLIISLGFIKSKQIYYVLKKDWFLKNEEI